MTLIVIWMGDVAREVNARLLVRGLSLLSYNGKDWNMNQLLFADDTALMADSQEGL